MAAVIKLYNLYRYTVDELSDPRSRDWLPVTSTAYPITLVILYVKFANDWGPRFMKNKEAYNLKNVIAAYNASQIIINLWFFYTGVIYINTHGYDWFCQSMTYKTSGPEMELLYLTRYFFLLKTYDLLDTVFHVLRKKQSHVSFVHVYHHAGMFLISWGAVKFVPGGHGALLGFMNNIVHSIMYSYYLLALLYPQHIKNVWWKKHLTQLQMAQFLINFVHLGLPLVWTDCDYPRVGLWIMCPQNLFMFLLFLDFYIKTYRNKSKRKTE